VDDYSRSARLRAGRRTFYVDLGAEHLLAAMKAQQRIAVEVKSFGSVSLIADLEQALGQFALYWAVLQTVDPERRLYLAVDMRTFGGLFSEPIGQIVLEGMQVNVMIFDSEREVIVRWIP
jgi:hypothetical protein